jgi:choline-glycine betaine transporter
LYLVVDCGVCSRLACSPLAFASTGDPSGSLDLLKRLRGDITLYCTWFFIGGKAVRFFFLLYLVYRFGGIKLGKKDDKPEFSALSYFSVSAMICCKDIECLTQSIYIVHCAL